MPGLCGSELSTDWIFAFIPLCSCLLHIRFLHYTVSGGDVSMLLVGYPELFKSLFLSPPTPKIRKRRFCRLGAGAPRRQNRLFLLERGLPLLSATFEKPYGISLADSQNTA